MSTKILASMLALAAAGMPASACAMSATTPHCQVMGADKLPAEVGGASAVCAAFDQAMAKALPKVRYTANIEVRSKAAMTATLTANGRELPKHELTVMDRNLNIRSIERFAAELAAELAKVTKS
jgi:hypothetical protein